MHTFGRMRILTILFCSCLCYFAEAQIQPTELGVILDAVEVTGSKKESFALYLPKSYNPKNASFIVFIFDPAARGRIGIAPFIPAAETYNLILVCSNDSKNGPFGKNLQIANRLFDHVFTNFNIAKEGVYTAGFSGGSRLAITIAVLSNAIQGVIGCGAAFSGNSAHYPTPQNSFSYAGLVGDSDMNFLEMQRAGHWLNKMNIANELFIYEGDHNWPPPKQILRAFGWLELQAYKKKIKPFSPPKLKSLYIYSHSRAKAHEDNGELLMAVREFEMIDRNFSWHYQLDSIASRIRRIKKSGDFKQAFKEEVRHNRLEDTLSRRFSRKFHEQVQFADVPDYKWWQKQLEKLNKNYLNSEHKALKKRGQRLRYQLFALALESFDGFVSNKEIKKAIYAGGLLELLKPNRQFSHYKLASGFTKLGLFEKAIYHIEKALKLGIDNALFQKNNSEFSVIQNDKRFKLLMKNYADQTN